jgi:hypothetical protein
MELDRSSLDAPLERCQLLLESLLEGNHAKPGPSDKVEISARLRRADFVNRTLRKATWQVHAKCTRLVRSKQMACFQPVFGSFSPQFRQELPQLFCEYRVNTCGGKWPAFPSRAGSSRAESLSKGRFL